MDIFYRFKLFDNNNNVFATPINEKQFFEHYPLRSAFIKLHAPVFTEYYGYQYALITEQITVLVDIDDRDIKPLIDLFSGVNQPENIKLQLLLSDKKVILKPCFSDLKENYKTKTQVIDHLHKSKVNFVEILGRSQC